MSNSLANLIVEPVHKGMVSGRRINVLSRNIAEFLPDTVSQGLDIGCGDGAISNLLMSLRPELTISGVDVLVREKTFVPVTKFDGIKLPFDDKSFDFCMLIDVLHHTDFQIELLKESLRVASKFVIIKDHYCENHFDRTILQFMDWVGNKAYGVNLPYNYLSTKQWSSLYESLGMKQTKLVSSLGLYPFPASMIFDANLHFITRLDVF